MRQKLLVLVGTAILGILVALTYFVFEFAVHHSISFVWNTLFNTDENRLLVMPIAIALSVVFFGVRHWLDKSSEEQESHSLGGEKVKASIRAFLIVLVVGFFSLLAGASLGPEAILVPASMIIGALLATKVLKLKQKETQLLSGIALVALFAAFFHSFIIGLLSLLLLKAKSGVKLTPTLWVIAAIASAASALTLMVIDPTGSYFTWPDYNFKVRIMDILIAIVLAGVGFAATFVIRYTHDIAAEVRMRFENKDWWVIALVAGIGLGILYLLGGQYVQFTGNESIEPLLANADSIGLFGLLWILIIKLFAIGWSKALWFRGGMIFPTIFVATVIIAIAGQLYSEVNYFLWLIAIMAGALAAEKKAKILF